MTQPAEFSKLFTHPEMGQVLVLLDEGAEPGPEIHIYCRPAGVSICSVVYPYADSVEGLQEAQADFERLDETQAFEIAAQMFEKMATN